MCYKIILHERKEGYSASCPDLPDCWSQGTTESEALENIRDAIREHLAAVDDLIRNPSDTEARKINVTA